MYNRYIPQKDGSYRRDRVPSSPQPPRPPEPEMPPPPPPQEPAPPQEPFTPPERQAPPPPSRQTVGAESFLRRILPKDFDTGDLLIVMLLLLMSGDSSEDQNFALLTLALYCFM